MTSGTSTIIGSGYANTYTAMTPPVLPAAEAVRHAAHGGFSDWFLPSKDELNQMYLQRRVIGGFASAAYWSSSESNGDLAWFHVFNDAATGTTARLFEVGVRAVRRF